MNPPTPNQRPSALPEMSEEEQREMDDLLGASPSGERPHNWLEVPETVTSPVLGHDVTFQEVGYNTFRKMRPLLEKVGKALMVLRRGAEAYSGVSQKVERDGRKLPVSFDEAGKASPKGEGFMEIPGELQEKFTTAPSLEMAKYRDSAQAAAVSSLVRIIDDEKDSAMLLELISESTVPSISIESLRRARISALKDLLAGVAKAHERLFGPLIQEVQGALRPTTEDSPETNPNPTSTTHSPPSPTGSGFFPAEDTPKRFSPD